MKSFVNKGEKIYNVWMAGKSVGFNVDKFILEKLIQIMCTIHKSTLYSDESSREQRGGKKLYTNRISHVDLLLVEYSLTSINLSWQGSTVSLSIDEVIRKKTKFWGQNRKSFNSVWHLFQNHI